MTYCTDLDYDERPTYNKFMIVWHMFGIEAVVDLDRVEQDFVAAKLQGNPLIKSSGYLIDFYLLRARVNTERNYEIWGVNLPTGTTTDDVFNWFDADNQAFVNLIRRLGVCILPKHGQEPVIR